MKRLLAIAASTLVALNGCGDSVNAQSQFPATSVAMKSASWQGAPVACGPNAGSPDDTMPLGGTGEWNTITAQPGGGQFPNDRILNIYAVCVSHFGSFNNARAFSGHSGPNGDPVTPYVIGQGTQCMTYNTTPVVFTPGEYFDVHADCDTGGTHTAILQIWYTPR
jgi:hypothetical protein